MDANRFTGLGFVASYWNADAAAIKPLGAVSGLAVQITWGSAPAERTDPPNELQAWLARTRSYGLHVTPWGWCNASDIARAEDEGRYHAERAIAMGFRDEWIANMEHPYDAGGNSSSPKYEMPAAYAEGFTEAAKRAGVTFKALAITTTPFFGSSMAELAFAGWVTMPQAFSGDYAPATVDACVEHMQDWGWPPALIRPLVQVYKSANGQRPPVQPFLDDSAANGVGVVPYIVEQCMDDTARLQALAPATFRPPSGAAPIPPPDGGDVQPIGSQDGVTASCNRLRDMDPAGTLLKKSGSKWPSIDTLAAMPLDQWKAYDKLERALKILVTDHDEMAGL